MMTVPKMGSFTAWTKKTGKIVWQQMAHEGIPKIRRHPKPPTPTAPLPTDGKRLVAFFGSEGSTAMTWADICIGRRTSAVLEAGPYDYLNCDGICKLAILPMAWCTSNAMSLRILPRALDAKDGREIWRTPKTNVATWSTPAIVTLGSRMQLVVNGWNTWRVRCKNRQGVMEAWRRWRYAGANTYNGHNLIFIQNPTGKWPRLRHTSDGDCDITLRETYRKRTYCLGVRRGGGYLQTPFDLRRLLLQLA